MHFFAAFVGRKRGQHKLGFQAETAVAIECETAIHSIRHAVNVKVHLVGDRIRRTHLRCLKGESGRKQDADERPSGYRMMSHDDSSRDLLVERGGRSYQNDDSVRIPDSSGA